MGGSALGEGGGWRHTRHHRGGVIRVLLKGVGGWVGGSKEGRWVGLWGGSAPPPPPSGDPELLEVPKKFFGPN